MSSHKILKINNAHPQLECSLVKELGISYILARILVNRGLKSPLAAEKFLRVKLTDLEDPFSFRQMHQAVELIRKAARKKEKALIFSDYDVDGVTSLALLKDVFSKMGICVLHHLPHRIKEGYGLNNTILNFVKQEGIGLVVTADCGTNSHQEIKELKRIGANVLITDHHEPLLKEETPATSIINPKIAGCGYPYRDLAGVGVAYKLCQALTGKALEEELDLVALGTIADVVPLVSENRVIAKFGLERISQRKRPGLEALMKSSRLKARAINATFVSFILAPRLNASGRMDSAEASLQLLLSKEKEQAEVLAAVIEGHNRHRQKTEAQILDQALALIGREVNFAQHRVIVLAGDNWHQGVLGIVASKLADRFLRPTILISKGAHLCKGSGRSIKNFNLFQALLECAGSLETFGGHAHAAGLVVSREKIPLFREKINCLAQERLMLEDLLPSIEVDMELGLKDLNLRLAQELESLEPFGASNPEPLFYTRKLKLKSEPALLARGTLKFWVSDGEFTHLAIGFGMAPLKDSLMQADTLDIVYTPKIDIWQEEESLILEVKDIFLS